LEKGHVRIANELVTHIAKAHLSGPERACLDCIIYQTYGWNRKMAPIAGTFFVDFTGYSRKTCYNAVQILFKRNIILRNSKKRPLLYGVQKDYEKWVELSQQVANSLPSKVATPLPTKVANSLPSTATPVCHQKNKNQEPVKTFAEDELHKTWLTPYLEMAKKHRWRPSAGKLAKYLSGPHKEFGADDTLKRWALFLKQTKADFYSPALFAERVERFSPEKVRIEHVEDHLDRERGSKTREVEREPRVTGDSLQRLHINIKKELKRA